MNLRAVRCLVAVGVGALVGVGAACKSGPDDSTITESVRIKMEADATVPASRVAVDTKDGIVTISGTVDSDAEKARAESIARATNGVKSVTNNLRVSPSMATTEPRTATSAEFLYEAKRALAEHGGLSELPELQDVAVADPGQIAVGEIIKESPRELYLDATPCEREARWKQIKIFLQPYEKRSVGSATCTPRNRRYSSYRVAQMSRPPRGPR